MEIRKAEISDLTGLSTLFDGYRQFYRQKPDAAAASAFIRERLLFKDSVIFIARDGPLLVGFVQLYPSFSSVAMRPIFVLNDLFVSASARNRGVATALLKKSERFASEAGAVRLTLATEITNVTAQALYEKLGWHKNETFYYYSKRVEA